MGTFIVVVFFAVVTLCFVLLFRYEKKNKQGKTAWFKKLGLKFDLSHQVKQQGLAKMNTLSGKINSHSVVIYEYPAGRVGDHKTINTMTRFQPNPFDFEFSIGKEGLSSKIGKAFGAKDIEFGNEEFDKTFMLNSNKEDRFRNLLDIRVQDALRELYPDLSGFINSTASSFEYNVTGPLTKQGRREEYERVVDFMCLLLKKQP